MAVSAAAIVPADVPGANQRVDAPDVARHEFILDAPWAVGNSSRLFNIEEEGESVYSCAQDGQMPKPMKQLAQPPLHANIPAAIVQEKQAPQTARKYVKSVEKPSQVLVDEPEEDPKEEISAPLRTSKRVRKVEKPIQVLVTEEEEDLPSPPVSAPEAVATLVNPLPSPREEIPTPTYLHTSREPAIDSYRAVSRKRGKRAVDVARVAVVASLYGVSPKQVRPQTVSPAASHASLRTISDTLISPRLRQAGISHLHLHSGLQSPRQDALVDTSRIPPDQIRRTLSAIRMSRSGARYAAETVLSSPRNDWPLVMHCDNPQDGRPSQWAPEPFSDSGGVRYSEDALDAYTYDDRPVESPLAPSAHSRSMRLPATAQNGSRRKHI
jgi:hypothetical protein